MLFKRIIQNQKKVESLCITCIMYSQFVIIDSPTSCLFSWMSYMANYYIPPSTSQMEFLYRTAAYLWKYRISAVKQILSSSACQFNFSYKLCILLTMYAINKGKEPEEIGYRLRNFFNIHLYFKYLFFTLLSMGFCVWKQCYKYQIKKSQILKTCSAFHPF